MRDLTGEGMILDEKGEILYHPVSSQVMKPYQGQQLQNASFYDETSPTNTRQFVYYQPVTGRPWAVVLTVPARFGPADGAGYRSSRCWGCCWFFRSSPLSSCD